MIQAIWLELVRRLPRWRFDPARGTIGAWVAKIARREALRRARRRWPLRQRPLDPVVESLLDPEPSPEEVLEEAQRHELFESLVLSFSATLREPDRQIVLMHWLERCSVLVICRRVNKCESSVCSVLRRAKPKLAKQLRRAGIGTA